MRDASLDIDDPDANLADPAWQRSKIIQQRASTPGKNVIINVEVINDTLNFNRGVFGRKDLKFLIRPTMKGLWVPITVGSDAILVFDFDELVGLAGCNEHVNGEIMIASTAMRSFDLVPIKTIHTLHIGNCVNLNDLKKLPSVLVSLTINKEQLKGNLKHVVSAMSSVCDIKIYEHNAPLNGNRPRDVVLEQLIINAVNEKAGRASLANVLLGLQRELIERDYDDYADL